MDMPLEQILYSHDSTVAQHLAAMRELQESNILRLSSVLPEETMRLIHSTMHSDNQGFNAPHHGEADPQDDYICGPVNDSAIEDLEGRV